MPSQLTTAKTIFIAWAGGGNDLLHGDLIYADVQKALMATGHYTVVTKPADAELSIRASFSNGIRLKVFDTKTAMLLWTITEPFNISGRPTKNISNINDACVKAIADLDAVASGKIPNIY